MAIQVALNHRTVYRYDRWVNLLPHVVRLRPAPHCRTPILSYSLKIEPEPHFLNWQQDPYSNFQARIVFPKPVQEFKVEVDLVAEMVPLNPFDFFIEPTAEKYPFNYDSILARELLPYLEAAPESARLDRLVESLRRPAACTVDYLVELNQEINKLVRYVIRMEPGVQSCEETLTLGKGSCRDSAWLLVQLLRRLGLAARFVSGYLIQLTADQKALDGPSGAEKDFTDLHAWAEAYLPGAGWVGLDPTSGLMASEGHIPLACAAEPITAAPITGSYTWTKDLALSDEDRCTESFDFQMSIARVRETPRVTKPYTEDEWQAIETLGQFIDDKLHDSDVRLTMGGEPTFVSVDDPDAPEWNTAALGADKERKGRKLLRRLRDRFAPGALLHHGQGKWYPGEPLPRWAYSCCWRRDGVPIWRCEELYADQDRNYGHGPEDSQRFISALAGRLGIDANKCIPGYEDVLYYLWREGQLPVNVDPLKSRLDSPEERARLARLFDQGLDKVIGHVLPLRRGQSAGQRCWQSGVWVLRRQHLFLIPGDSPLGYRLPLDALPWELPESRDQVHPRDPFATRGILPNVAELNGQLKVPAGVGSNSSSGSAANALAVQLPIIRTALCVEPRVGRLHVFLPPVETLEDYLELIGALEATAEELQLPVVLEGYKPPSDYRINQFQITPDPGVLEVNVQPAYDWNELVHNTTTIYEEARQTRLSTEKFMLVGRHSSTGGGNHVVLGGPRPVDSPFLRRPDLLRSLLACWHNHPSLSYLFSSLFIGPTSQAPRVDEARNDSLYELELAFKQLPDQSVCPHWLVDRVFRHLLIDGAGNTHRAEFCIDKLFSPDSADGRRGLLELRAFEMPPHARMSLVQQLLVRALIARFWNSPYSHRLARWGTELHDRFMLPHFVEQDLEDLLTEMKQAGYPIQKSWFAPHLEFRFPCLGVVTYRGTTIEIRQAMEPWHVLGEEQGAGGTARYVDSSIERIQVKVSGLADSRHVVTCNGRRLPLHPTGTNGEFVAGVRYRAWQPPSCLHPTIPSHAPLVFDLFDTWTNRSMGGCQYHVAHPGGRHYETFPVNAGAAEDRRHARFRPFGHTSGGFELPPAEKLAEFPLTLDLRQSPPEASMQIGPVKEEQSAPRFPVGIKESTADFAPSRVLEEQLW